MLIGLAKYDIIRHISFLFLKKGIYFACIEEVMINKDFFKVRNKIMRNRIIFACFLLCAILIMFLYQQSQEKYNKGYLDYFKAEKQITTEEKEWLETKDKLVFGADAFFEPLGYEERGKYTGFFADYIHEISKKLNKEIEIKFIENNKIQQELMSGGIDFTIMRYSYKGEQYAEFSYPIIKATGVLCSNLDLSYSDLNELKYKTIIITKDDVDFVILDKSNNVRYIYANNLKEGVDMLVKGQGHALIGEEIVIAHYLYEKDLYDEYYFAPIRVYQKNYVLSVHDENIMLKSILNKMVQNIPMDGTLKNLQLKWFGFSASLVHENISDRMAIFMLIIFTALATVFYFFYEINKSLYSELEERMEQLTISKNDLQTTFDGVSYLMIEIDKNRNIQNINKAFSRQLKISKNKAIGEKLYNILKLNQNNKILLNNVIKATFDLGKEGKAEINYDGKIYEASIYPLRDARDRISKSLLMLNDVSRARAAERQMIQNNKMIAVGQLAAGVAHEIRNPLGLIRNYCYVLKNEGMANKEIREKAISVIERAVEKSGAIINNLLNFSRISSNRWEEINVYQFINSFISLEKNILEKNKINLILDFDKSINIYTITEAFEIIMVNLISNAVDAIKSGGEIRISCHLEKDVIIVQFSDTGEGIPPKIIDNIFNPFFTTKENGKGTGLGLYIVYNEVQKLGGDIQVESVLNKGTVFTITLPNQRGEINDEKQI